MGCRSWFKHIYWSPSQILLQARRQILKVASGVFYFWVDAVWGSHQNQCLWTRQLCGHQPGKTCSHMEQAGCSILLRFIIMVSGSNEPAQRIMGVWDLERWSPLDRGLRHVNGKHAPSLISQIRFPMQSADLQSCPNRGAWDSYRRKPQHLPQCRSGHKNPECSIRSASSSRRAIGGLSPENTDDHARQWCP